MRLPRRFPLGNGAAFLNFYREKTEICLQWLWNVAIIKT